MNRITCGQAEIRMNRAFQWLMATEPPQGVLGDNPRWTTFCRIRDRLRPYRLPLQARISLCLFGLARITTEEGMKRADEEALETINAEWNTVNVA
jgi:hypothetical protein